MKPDHIGNGLLIATVFVGVLTAVYFAECVTGCFSRLFGRKA